MGTTVQSVTSMEDGRREGQGLGVGIWSPSNEVDEGRSVDGAREVSLMEGDNHIPNGTPSRFTSRHSQIREECMEPSGWRPHVLSSVHISG